MGKLVDDTKRFKAMRRDMTPLQKDELDALVTIYEAINTSGQGSLRQEFSNKWERLSDEL